MYVMIGLGNPGAEYQATRHNVGVLFLRAYAGKVNWKKHAPSKAFVAKSSDSLEEYYLPQTYMNLSGSTLLAIKKRHPKLEGTQLLVFHDDLDLQTGTYKLQFGKGPHDHNGLLSLYQAWGSKDFWHVRIGVDGRDGLRLNSGKDYVLQSFSQEEVMLLEAVMVKVFQDIRTTCLI